MTHFKCSRKATLTLKLGGTLNGVPFAFLRYSAPCAQSLSPLKFLQKNHQVEGLLMLVPSDNMRGSGN
jgi:hypothetical protein